jgi:thermitase
LLPPSSPIKVGGIKVLNSFGFGTQEQIIKGMIEAVDKGASVISLSLGAITNESKEKAYSEAVDYATKHNVIVVVAAGNSSADASNYSPANTNGVITVSSNNFKKSKSKFANHLDNIKMGIYAPGEDILSCLPKDKYKAQSGTSMAAPYVAGFTALLKYFDPEMTAEEVYHILSSTSEVNSEGQEIMNAEKAIEYFFSEALSFQ